MSNEPDNVTPEKWVNLKDIAVHLSLSEDTVRTWVKEGELPFYRAGKRYKFKISELEPKEPTICKCRKCSTM